MSHNVTVLVHGSSVVGLPSRRDTGLRTLHLWPFIHDCKALPTDTVTDTSLPVMQAVLRDGQKGIACEVNSDYKEAPLSAPLPPNARSHSGKKFLSSCTIGNGCPLPVPSCHCLPAIGGGIPPQGLRREFSYTNPPPARCQAFDLIFSEWPLPLAGSVRSGSVTVPLCSGLSRFSPFCTAWEIPFSIAHTPCISRLLSVLLMFCFVSVLPRAGHLVSVCPASAFLLRGEIPCPVSTVFARSNMHL